MCFISNWKKWNYLFWNSEKALLARLLRVVLLGAEAASPGRWKLLAEASEGVRGFVEARVAIFRVLGEDAGAGALLILKHFSGLAANVEMLCK